MNRRSSTYTIIHTAWLYGEGKNFVNTSKRLPKIKDSNVLRDHMTTSALEAQERDEYSWYAFARKVLEHTYIHPVSQEHVHVDKRRRWSVLHSREQEHLEVNTLPHFIQSLETYLKNHT